MSEAKCELCGEPMPPLDIGPRSITVNLRVNSATCPNCRRDNTREADTTIEIVVGTNHIISPQLFYCQHCNIFFCQAIQ